VRLVPSILRCLGPNLLVGSWIDVLCIFVLDHDASISGFGLRLKDFGWNPRSLCDLSRISIPLDSVGLELQIRRYSMS
jgi:hypothetical protein